MIEDPVLCPSCAQPMHAQAFERKLAGELQIDICFACKLIWFDQYESLQLAPGGLLDLFRLIYAHRGDPSIPVAGRLDCPRCNVPLTLTHTLQRSTRFVYYRCESGHGRLSSFYQFLREKNFVRELGADEVARLKADIKQVSCSSCGAPINLRTDSACSFCKAPISILDANALHEALRGIVAEKEQRGVTAGLASIENMIAALEVEQRKNEERRREAIQWAAGLDRAPDMVGIGIGMVANAFFK